jgi:hypothetical protein
MIINLAAPKSQSAANGLNSTLLLGYTYDKRCFLVNFERLSGLISGLRVFPNQTKVLLTISAGKSQGIADFRAPPPIPKFIDASEALDELPSYDSFEPAPDDF